MKSSWWLLGLFCGIFIEFSGIGRRNVSDRDPGATTVAFADAVASPWQEPSSPAPEGSLSDEQLRLLIQQQQNEMLSRLIRQDASQLSGSAGFLARLELDSGQHRELGKIIAANQTKAEAIVQEATQTASRTKDPDTRQAISRETYERVARLAEDGLDEFKQRLLPHQVEQLEQMMEVVRFQAILRICQLHDEPWPRVAGAYLGLSADETRRFQVAIEQAVTHYRSKMDEVRRELARELGEACPPRTRGTWTKILGEDPREMAEFLTSAGLLAQ